MASYAKKQQGFRFFANNGGLNTKSSPLSMPLGDSPDLLNVDLTQTGGVKKRRGCREYTAAPVGAGGTITGLFRIVETDGSTHMLACENDDIWLETTPGAGDYTTHLGGGFHVGQIWSGVPYNNCIYLANGWDAPQYYDAAAGTLAAMATAPGAALPPAWAGTDQPSGFSIIAPYRGERLCAWGTDDDPSRIWISELDNPVDFNGAGGVTLLVLPGDSERVRAVVPFYDLTLVFKDTKAAVYTGIDDADLVALQQWYPVGCAAPRSIVQVGRDLYFWSNRGPARASGIEQYGDISPMGIAVKIESLVDACNWNQAHQVVAAHDKANSRIIWWYPTSGGQNNRAILVYHYDIDAWSRYDNIQGHSGLTYESVGGETTVLAGGYDGRVRELGYGYRDVCDAYTSYYVTPWYDFETIGITKRVRDLIIAYGSDGHDADVYYQWDQEGTWRHLGHISDFIDPDTALWGAVDWGAFVWGAGQAGPARAHPLGAGRMFRLKFYDNTIDTNWNLLGWEMLVGYRGRRG